MAITPIDGRYRDKVVIFEKIFSEFGLQKYRTRTEIRWLFFLGEILNIFQLSSKERRRIEIKFFPKFKIGSALRIKELEKTTNHDVKAVEYYIQEKLQELNLGHLRQWVHFSLTSEDVTNIAIAEMLEEGTNVLLEELNKLLAKLEQLARYYKKTPMMSHTHGQPASPSTVGKEFVNFAWRLREEINTFSNQKFKAKINGASGNYNAASIAFPEIDWIKASTDFITKYLAFEANLFTVQTNSYGYISEICHNLVRIASVIIDLDQDMWTYISKGYFSQKLKEGEVGSSTMPHKINPIDFENSEGNSQMAIPILEHFARKLLVTRMQRDLTDSTTLRNLGLAFSYILIGIKSTLKGLEKITANEKIMKKDLTNNPELLAEPIQTVLRARGAADAYERLKDLTRGKRITRKTLVAFIKDQPEFTEEDVNRLTALTSAKYIGKAVELVDHYFETYQK